MTTPAPQCKRRNAAIFELVWAFDIYCSHKNFIISHW